MVLNPVSLMNYLVLGISVYLMSSCESSLGCFIAFELNLISSIVLLHWGPRGSLITGVYIYFQALGTAFFAMGCTISNSSLMGLEEKIMSNVVWGSLCFGFFVKVGCFPFHRWVWVVLSKNSWVNIFIFGVVQKYGQLIMLSSLGISGFCAFMVFLSFFLTSVLGGFLGFSGDGIRELMVASSLLQTGIMGILATVSNFDFKMYFAFYLLLNLNFLLSQHFLGGANYFALDIGKKSQKVESWILGWYSLCLMGFPPSSGFLMKAYLISGMLGSGSYFFLVLVMVVSVMSSGWYYLIMKKFWLFPILSGRSMEGLRVSWTGVSNYLTFFGLMSVDFVLSGSMMLMYYYI